MSAALEPLSLAHASSANAEELVARLLRLEDEEALETALEEAGPGLAARAICLAPTLERKTELLWAMEDRQRRDALELVPSPLVAALVQNLEDDNRYLLGDLSLEAFSALLDLCSPERQFYWILTALSFTDVRANALPLLLPTQQLVEIFLTRAEWEVHLKGLGDYPIEDARLTPEQLVDPAQALVDYFGPEGFLRQFPVNDADLEKAIQLILDFNADRYVDLIRAGLRSLDYADNHPEEWTDLTEAPVLLNSLEPIPLVSEAMLSEPEPPSLDAEWVPDPGPALALQPVGAPPLARLQGALPPATQQRVANELQYAYIRQAVAEGGSFHRDDLRMVARSVEAYLLLGLQAEAGGNPERQSQVVGAKPLHKISHTGARLVERLRQPALRLQPMEEALGPEQRALVRSLATPRMTLSAEGEPRIRLLPGAGGGDAVDLPTAAVRLREVQVWTALARSVGLAATAAVLKRTGSLEGVLSELVLTAVLYARLELGLVEPTDLLRFGRQYLSPVAQEVLPSARQGIATLASQWAQSRGMAAEDVLPFLERGLERLAAEAVKALADGSEGRR